MDNYSLSDLRSVVDNDGFGGNNGLLVILFLIILLGGGRWGGDGYGQYATAASQQEILFGQQFQNIDNKLDRLGNGIADATFALNNAVTTEGRNLQNLLYTHDASTKEAIHNEGEATRKMLYESKIESLQGQISQLQLQNAMCGVVKYPMATTWNAGGNPFCNCNSGCGCNNI